MHKSSFFYKLQAENTCLAFARLDGEHDDKRQAEADGEANGNADELESGLETGDVGRRRSRLVIFLSKCEQTTIAKTARKLEQDGGDLNGRRNKKEIG